GTVALAAPNIDQVDLSGRSSRRNFDPPFARFCNLRQRREVRGQIGSVLTAELTFDKGRHDAPRLSNGALELGGVQPAAGEIRPKTTLARAAVAVPACRRPGGLPVPVCFSRRGTARGLSRNPPRSKRERK